MLRRLFAGGLIFVCCGCSTAAMNTDVASTRWRMENLEQRFLDFREKAAMREADLSARIAKLEKKVGLPVPSQEEMILTSTQLTPDVHVFAKRGTIVTSQPATTASKQKAPASAAVQKGETTHSSSSKRPDKKYSVDIQKKKEDEKAAIAMFIPKTSQPKAAKSPAIQKHTSAQPTPTAGKTLSASATKPVSSKSAAKPRVLKHTKPSPTVTASRVTNVAVVPKRVVPVPAKKKGASSMYKHGLELLGSGAYEQGRERLEEFLTEFPSHDLVPNAVYWVGESFYSQKDFRLAIDLFREVLLRFPKSNKARAAMLKIGYSYKKLHEISEARRFLLKVVETYPKSNEARLARKMLSGF